MSETVRCGIVAASGHDITRDILFRLSNNDTKYYMCLALRPRDMADFVSKMQSALTFNLPPGYEPSATNYMELRSHFSEYCDFFKSCYSFLVSVAQPQDVAPLNHTDHGLIKPFLAAIPYDLGVDLRSQLATSKYTSIIDFVTEVSLLAEIMFDTIQAASGKRIPSFARKLFGKEFNSNVKPLSGDARLSHVQSASIPTMTDDDTNDALYATEDCLNAINTPAYHLLKKDVPSAGARDPDYDRNRTFSRDKSAPPRNFKQLPCRSY